jgi:hypothetical protein
MPKPDFTFTDCGSITLVRPDNADAQAYLEEATEGQWFAGALACEPRYAPDLSAELCRAGFCVTLPDGRDVTAADLVEA